MTTSSPSKYDINLPQQGSIKPRRIHLSPFSPSSSTTAGSVLAYLGIPFSQPPNGQNRWRVPQGPLPAWTSPRESEWRSDPYQDFASMEGMYRGRSGAKTSIPPSEDCLYLNVWLPETSSSHGEKKPVLVWIYGGAFVVGNCSRPIHDGARLAHESGCIVVSLTYRVGPMGFLGSKSMLDDAAGEWPLLTLDSLRAKPSQEHGVGVGAGNWGLYDLIAGLLWVQHSISSFGGDEANVTVFGESAGSIAIHYLFLSPLTPEGLFHKAILQSGVVATLLPRTTEAAQAAYDFIIRSFCPPHLEGDERAQLEYLKTRISADQIAAAFRPFIGKRPRSEYTPTQNDVNRLPPAREEAGGEKFAVTDQWGPVWDGVFIDPDFVERALGPMPRKSDLKNGKAGIVVGMCADEGTMFNFLVSTSSCLSEHQSLFHRGLSADLGQVYSFDSTELATKFSGKEKTRRDREAFYTCATYTGDAQFTAPILDYLTVQNESKEGQGDKVEVYGYLLAYRPSMGMLETLTVVPEMTEEWGAFHTLDIPFVFGVTGEDTHPFVGNMEEYGVDPDQDDSDPRQQKQEVGSKRVGMTKEEKELSLFTMRTWATLAKLPAQGSDSSKVLLPDGTSWTALGTEPVVERGGVGDINLLTIGEAPQMPTSLQTTVEQKIPVKQMKLSQHPFSQQQPVGDASLEERVRFWMHDPITGTTPSIREGGVGLSRAVQNYYGFVREPLCFLPWSQR